MKSKHTFKIVPGLPMAKYLAHPALSKHGLDLFAECAEKYKLKRDNPKPDAPTPAMQFGTAMHSAVFESRREYHVRPETYGSDNKPWISVAKECREWAKAHSDKPILTREQDEWISSLCAKVRADVRASKLLASGRAELSLFATDPTTGLELKTRPDWCSLDYSCVTDLKSINDASTENCQREIVKRRYHVQAAMNFRLLRLCGHNPAAFYFIFVEKGEIEPILNVRRLGEATLHLGESILDEELQRFAACNSADYWPGYSGEGDTIEDIEAPNWAFQLLEEKLELT
jgi:hypothetical protein